MILHMTPDLARTLGLLRPSGKADAKCRRLPTPRAARKVAGGADLRISLGMLDPMRAEWTRPEWRWPSRLMEFLASLPNMALGWRAAGPRRDPNTAAMEADRNEILDGTSLAL